MKRLIASFMTLAVALWIAAPAALAAEPTFDHSGTVLMAFNGDVTVAPDQVADGVLVVRGTATISGRVESIAVIDGSLVLDGAVVESVFVTGGSVTIDADSTVTGDVRTLDATVTADPAATVGGSIESLDQDLLAAGGILVPALLLFMLGFAVVLFVAGLCLAALASRQVRAAESLIRREPAATLLAGVAGLVVIPVAAILLMVTIIGAPLGLAIMFMVWPAAAFAGYLVAGIFIGEWLLQRDPATPVPERPYLAAILGLVVLQVISLVPFVGAIASLFGFGAVLLLGWRTFRHAGTERSAASPPATQPMGA